MRAAFYAPGWPPGKISNGIVTALATLAPALEARGCTTRVLAPAECFDGTGAANAVAMDNTPPPPAKRAGRAIRNRIFPARRIFVDPADRIARAVLSRPDLAASDIFEIEESFGWAARIQRRLPMPVVTALHGPWFMNGAAGSEDFPTRADERRIRLEGAALAAAEAISARSKHVLDAVRNRYELDLPDAVVIPNAAVLPDAPWRLQTADEKEILFVGRFDRHKGADLVLKAFAALAAERADLRLTFAGKIDRPLKENGRSYRTDDYLRAIMPTDAAARVTFLGPVPHDELGALRRRAFATVVASRIEIFPNVVLEALAHGAPTVTTAVGGIPEIARDAKEALLVPPRAEAIAAALGELLDDPQRAARLGAAGRARIAAEFSPDRVAALTIDYFRSVRDRLRPSKAA